MALPVGAKVDVKRCSKESANNDNYNYLDRNYQRQRSLGRRRMMRTMTAMLDDWVLFLLSLVLVAVELGEEVEVEVVEADEEVEMAEEAETDDEVDAIALAAA